MHFALGVVTTLLAPRIFFPMTSNTVKFAIKFHAYCTLQYLPNSAWKLVPLSEVVAAVFVSRMHTELVTMFCIIISSH